MSTRCVINFRKSQDGANIAKIYRHMDGYPDGAGGVLSDLDDFFNDVKAQTKDTRFSVPSYLAARFVVWQASRNVKSADRPLDFLSLAIVNESPDDIEWEYIVVCNLPFFPPDIFSVAKPSVYYWSTQDSIKKKESVFNEF